MRVALLGPVAWRTPPLHYGPWEQVTSLLAEGLVARGVDVTLYATQDSVTAARLDGVCPRGYADDPSLDGRVWEAMHVSHALARSDGFDLVHNHLDWLPLAFFQHCRAPLLTTVHGFSGAGILPAYAQATSAYVSISDADRVPELDYAATVHHGVDLDALPFDASGGDSLVTLGRIHPDKGTAAAIEIARRAGRRLVICGIVQDERYHAEQVEPHIDGDRVVYLGSVGPARRAAVLGSSHALLHPIGFAEPFGLSVVWNAGDRVRAWLDAGAGRRRSDRLPRRRVGAGSGSGRTRGGPGSRAVPRRGGASVLRQAHGRRLSCGVWTSPRPTEVASCFAGTRATRCSPRAGGPIRSTR